MSNLYINDKRVANNDKVSLTDITIPTFWHTDNSDITTILVYANGGYVQWLKYNAQDVFPFEKIVKPGVYTFYQFNSTNLDILGLIKDTTRENLTKTFRGRVFGKLIDQIRFNVVGPISATVSKLVKIPFTVTRQSLLNNSTLDEIRNICSSSPDVGQKICSDPLFLGDLANKYLISDLSDARQWAKDKDLNQVIQVIEKSQEWIEETFPFKDVLFFDKIINQKFKKERGIIVPYRIRGDIYKNISKEILRSSSENNYNEFARYIRVLKRINPENDNTYILGVLLNAPTAINHWIQMITDEEFDNLLNELIDDRYFDYIAALKPYLTEEDYNNSLNYRNPSEIDVISDKDVLDPDNNDSQVWDLVERILPEGQFVIHTVNNRRYILDAQTEESLQQFIQRFGAAQVVDGITFTLVPK